MKPGNCKHCNGMGHFKVAGASKLWCGTKTVECRKCRGTGKSPAATQRR